MNWSYVAGYFDGEGHVEKRAYGLSFANSHLVSIEALQEFMGCGTIETRPGTNKPVYHLRIRNLTDLRRVIPKLAKHCIVKREELVELLARSSDVRASPNYGLLKTIGVDEIKRLYWDEEMSCGEIAERLGLHGMSIHNFLLQHGGVRSQLDAMAAAGRRGRRRGRWSNGGFPMEKVDPGEVRCLYWEEGLSVRELGERFGVTRPGMRAYMERHAIPTRPRGHAATRPAAAR